jgi:dethiobiotin synthetase
MNIIIAGIHTGIGKTVCSAIITEALHYDYWKPVQAGELDATDSMFIQQHISNNATKIHPEAYRLKLAASPHWAADEEGLTIKIDELKIPVPDQGLVIETAGGLMSPLNKTETNLDLIKKFSYPIILVCSDYLGSINHSLLTIEVLKEHGVKIMGLVFSGQEVKTTRAYITSYSRIPILFSIPFFEQLNRQHISSFADSVSSSLKKIIDGFE